MYLHDVATDTVSSELTSCSSRPELPDTLVMSMCMPGKEYHSSEEDIIKKVRF